MISFLVAMDNNHVIGCDNQMLWHLPDDLKHFKKKTMGHTIIMGRKTFESIGRVLPGRKNVVITRDKTATFPDGVKVIHDIETVNRWNNERPDEEFLVIGGGGVYERVFPSAARVHITSIEPSFVGDTDYSHFSKSDGTKQGLLKGKETRKTLMTTTICNMVVNSKRGGDGLNICSVILAGGQSSRMGTNKALLPLHGKTVIEHISEELQAISDHHVIVANHPSDYQFLGVP